MIQIFEGAEWGEGSPVLNDMYRDRKRIFVDMLGWDVPVIDGTYEIDQFDDEHAIYVVATNERGEHDGSIRLLPSIRPHVLGNIFPNCAMGLSHLANISSNSAAPAFRRVTVRRTDWRSAIRSRRRSSSSRCFGAFAVSHASRIQDG